MCRITVMRVGGKAGFYLLEKRIMMKGFNMTLGSVIYFIQDG